MTLLALALLITGAMLLMQTPWAARRIRDLAVSQAGKVLNGTLEIDRLDGGFLTGVDLVGVRLRQGDSTPVVVSRVRVRYSAWQLVRGDAIVIKELQLVGLHVAGERTATGSLNLGQLLKPRQRPNEPRQRRPIEIRNIQISEGRVTFADPWGPGWMRLPQDISDLHAGLDLEYRDGHWLFAIQRLSADARAPALQIDAFRGDIHLDPAAWSVEKGDLRTPRSHVIFDLVIGTTPTGRTYDVKANATPFDFPEMASIVPGLRTLKVPATTVVTMQGPEQRVQTHVNVVSSAGDVTSDLLLDMTKPGWAGNGKAKLRAFNISQWLPTTTETRVTGSATFDLLLGVGRHFPRGTFLFDGPDVVYAGYEATHVRADGRLVEDRALINRATMTAYGAPISTTGWLGLPAPYEFALKGHATRLDLRRLPASLPLPKLRSDLTLDFDARGRFQNPVLAADATFGASTFLDAVIEPGTIGRIDTSADPITYAARGRISNLSLPALGEGFDIATLRQPDYAGVVAGAFDVDGRGETMNDLFLAVKGEDVTAKIFSGEFLDTSLDVVVRGDSLSGTSRGRFERLNLGRITGNAEFDSSVTGRHDVTGDLPGVFGPEPGLSAANIAGTIGLDESRIRSVDLTSASAQGRFAEGRAQFQELTVSSHGATLKASGTLAVLAGESDLNYDVDAPDLEQLRPLTPIPMAGTLTTTGRLTGPLDGLHLKGTVAANRFTAVSVDALSATGDYEISVPGRVLADATVNTTLKASFLAVAGTTLGAVNGRIAYTADRIEGEVEAHFPDRRVAKVEGAVTIHADHNEIHLGSARIQLGSQVWQLSKAKDPRIVWSPQIISVHDIALEGTAATSGRLTAFGSLGRTVPSGSISIDLRNLNVEDVPPLFPAAAGYRGILSGTALVTGTLAQPEVHVGLLVANGGFRQFTFTDLTLLARWAGEDIQGDLRIEQQPGLWLSVRGSIPTDVLEPRAKRPLNLTVRSSVIDLAVVQGLTTAVTNVTGTMQIDMNVRGNTQDPQFSGFVNFSNAGFLTQQTGVRYRNGFARFKMTPDNVVIEQFRIEDDKGDVLSLTGAAGTHKLRLGSMALELSASRFELLQNDLGDVDVNAVVTISGSLTSPVITGDVVLHRAAVRVDRLMERLQRPYQVTGSADVPSGATATQPPPQPSFAQRAEITLHVQAPNNLTLRGDDLRFNPGSALGLGSLDVTLGGDLTVRKAAGEQFAVNGALTAVRGFYGFQGRQFIVERGGSIRFVGGTIYDSVISVAASRTVAGVGVRVAVQGTVRKPELQLTSSPALEESDILSLLVFNVPANELGATEREQLAIRAASLAVGYVATPAISAFGQRLGLDFLQVEQTGNVSSGLRLSAGREIFRNLFLTYGREFGAFEYNEFLVEYELSRYLHIHANASDARGVRSRASLFRRVETAGIDLIFFFSY